MRKRAELLSFVHSSKTYRMVGKDMAGAIRHNADTSYTSKSPALQMAIESTKSWINLGKEKRLSILSTDYANYRQYGCGGIDIAILVEVSPQDRKKIKDKFARVLHNP